MKINDSAQRITKYKTLSILLAIMLAVLISLYLWERNSLNDSTMEAQFMWFMLHSETDSLAPYELICEQYGEIISEEDFAAFQKMGEDGFTTYPVMLCLDKKQKAAVLVQYGWNPDTESYHILNIKVLPAVYYEELQSLLSVEATQ